MESSVKSENSTEHNTDPGVLEVRNSSSGSSESQLVSRET